MISKLIAYLAGIPHVSGAAKVSPKPGLFTEVYEVREFNEALVPQWFFSWYKEDHSDGAILGPYLTKGDAELMRAAFIDKKKYDHAVVGVGV